ncbi:TetR/AcrR family transcriptional regulator [bacterium]|nr:TetR/AcrR family transcriptional regulator [bacterium]
MTTATTMKIRARSSSDKQIKRRKLLDTALDLFNRQGYQGTSIEMITEKAGVSTGTFYLYFKGKVEIYQLLNFEGNEILFRLIEDAMSWPGMTSIARLSAIAGAYYRYYAEYPGYYKISSILNIGQKDFRRKSEMQGQLNQQANQILRLIESVLQAGIDNGELEPVDTWQATTALWGMLDGLLILAEREHQNLIIDACDDFFKQGLNILIHGLLKRQDAV